MRTMGDIQPDILLLFRIDASTIRPSPNVSVKVPRKKEVAKPTCRVWETVSSFTRQQRRVCDRVENPTPISRWSAPETHGRGKRLISRCRVTHEVPGDRPTAAKRADCAVTYTT